VLVPSSGESGVVVESEVDPETTASPVLWVTESSGCGAGATGVGVLVSSGAVVGVCAASAPFGAVVSVAGSVVEGPVAEGSVVAGSVVEGPAVAGSVVAGSVVAGSAVAGSVVALSTACVGSFVVAVVSGGALVDGAAPAVVPLGSL
jgi:hypothetical protein